MSHLKDFNLTYIQHFKRATNIGTRMIGGGLCCLIHAVFPFWFCSIGSETIRKLKKEIDLGTTMIYLLIYQYWNDQDVKGVFTGLDKAKLGANQIFDEGTAYNILRIEEWIPNEKIVATWTFTNEEDWTREKVNDL